MHKQRALFEKKQETKVIVPDAFAEQAKPLAALLDSVRHIEGF